MYLKFNSGIHVDVKIKLIQKKKNELNVALHYTDIQKQIALKHGSINDKGQLNKMETENLVALFQFIFIVK